MDKIKVAFITTSRADYGLLVPLMKKIKADDAFDFNLVVTGSHLSSLHGRTVECITDDGFKNFDTVDMTGATDTDSGICEALAAGISGFSKIYTAKKPDLIVALGDRYELWPACMAAVIHKIDRKSVV